MEDAAGGRMPRQSAIKMMETMKQIAPHERRGERSSGAAAVRAQAASAPACESVGVHAHSSRKQPLPTTSAAAAEPAVKRRRQQGAPEVNVLEWLEAEAEKRPIDQTTPALPPGIEPPERPQAAALLFMHKIKGRIKQPPSGAWTPKQLAQGVTRLFEALPPAHQQQYRGTAKDEMDKYKAELARLRPVGSKTIETSSTDQGLRGGKSPSAFKIYERNVMPRLRHANTNKTEDDLMKLCKKEWAGISEKEKRTYQFLAERDRERLRTQELLWRGASLGTSRQSLGDNAGGHRTGERTFHTLIPQFCAFCGQPIVTYLEPKKHCKSCGRAFTLEIVAFAVGGRGGGSSANAKDEDLDVRSL